MSIAVVLEEGTENPPEPRPEHHHPMPATGFDAAADARDEAAGAVAPTRRVLVAEDEAGMRGSLAEILRSAGHIVTEAENGEVALRILNEKPIDVLVLDLVMPVRDGISLLQEIDPPPPVVVVYSAFEYVTPTQLRDAVGTKVFRTLEKPASPRAIIALVADAVEAFDHLEDN